MNAKIILKMSCMLLLVLLSVDCWAQSGKSTLQLLQDKVWVMQLPAEKTYYVEKKYTDREVITTIIINGQTVKHIVPYYLADMFQGYYDSKQEGKVTDGKMIITLFGEDGVNALKQSPTGILYAGNPMLIKYVQIIEISSTVLKLWFPDPAVLLEYKAK